MKTALTPRQGSALASFFGRAPILQTLGHEFDDLLSRMSANWYGGEQLAIPFVDVSETDTQVLLEVDLPGMKPDEVNVDVAGQVVRIRGEHKEEKDEENKTYHRIERRSGSFFRAVELPCAVDETRVSAVFKNGVLKVTLPKTDAAKSQKIAIKVSGK